MVNTTTPTEGQKMAKEGSTGTFLGYENTVLLVELSDDEAAEVQMALELSRCAVGQLLDMVMHDAPEILEPGLATLGLLDVIAEKFGGAVPGDAVQ
jgi:hypothetical protein